MTQGVNDAALQEIHDEMYRVEEERPKKGFGTFDKKTRFWVLVVVGGLVLAWFFEKLTLIQAGVIGLIVLMVMGFSTGSSSERKELTMIECMIRLNDLLTFLQEHPIGQFPQIPKGEIRIKLIGKKQWFQGQGFKRSFAVDIYEDERDVTEMYYAEIDIMTGDLITFRSAPEGVIGDEKKDIILLPDVNMRLQKKRDEYIGQNLFGKT